jgi:hypothetical protein
MIPAHKVFYKKQIMEYVNREQLLRIIAVTWCLHRSYEILQETNPEKNKTGLLI